jgi:acyl dehydratase
MTKESVITEEIRNAVGMQFGPYTYEVEKGAVKPVAEAIEDTNPLWQDEEYARRSSYAGIIASPTFLFTLRYDELLSALGNWIALSKTNLMVAAKLNISNPLDPGM